MFIISCNNSHADNPLATYKGQTLCTGEEEIVFSCPIKKKTLSVCSSKELTREKGYLSYRFGKKDKIELTYPEKPAHPYGLFRFSHYLRPGGAQNMGLEYSRLTFDVKDVTYEIFETYLSFESEDTGQLPGTYHGIDIIIPETDTSKKTITLNCTGEVTSKLTDLYFNLYKYDD